MQKPGGAERPAQDPAIVQVEVMVAWTRTDAAEVGWEVAGFWIYSGGGADRFADWLNAGWGKESSQAWLQDLWSEQWEEWIEMPIRISSGDVKYAVEYMCSGKRSRLELSSGESSDYRWHLKPWDLMRSPPAGGICVDRRGKAYPGSNILWAFTVGQAPS